MRVVIPILLIAAASVPLSGELLVLADFPEGLFNAPNWQWQGFADTVMGGRSELNSPTVVLSPNGRALQLAGQVVTRGGGFIQVRLEHTGGVFDAAGFSGVEVELAARAKGSYYLFARTRDNTFPWSYYGAYLEVPDQRTVLRIPWSEFRGESTLRRTIRPQLLTSIALVAAYQDFSADLLIYRIGLFR